MAAIVASWIVSPVFGAGIAALMLYFIKVKILYVEDRLAAAKRWVPVLIGLMAAAFMAYMLLKGLQGIWRPGAVEIFVLSGLRSEECRVGQVAVWTVRIRGLRFQY